MSENLVVSRIVCGELVCVGSIERPRGQAPRFSYDEGYRAREDAAQLSLSLPLRKEAYEERDFRPYFEGLLPEGETRAALAAQAAASRDDYLTLLGCAGLDCVGDVVVRGESEDASWNPGAYVSLSIEELRQTVRDLSTMASSNLATRLSLAGTQGKVGLAHLPGHPLAEGWMRPEGGAASTHILKTSSISRIAEFEIVCMLAAEPCGLSVAHTGIVGLGMPVICSERFDRRVSERDGLLVERLHQEDLAQAFGMSSAGKYLEVEGGTYHAIAQLIYQRSSQALLDVEQLARVAVFDYLVGNCDNHLKNLSILHEGETLRLAPAYDMVCTTFFERFSRDMGRRLGSTRDIDAVTSDDFMLLARDIGMGTRRMRGICRDMAGSIEEAVADAGDAYADVLATLPYTADDLIEDLRDRRAVVAAV